MGIYFNPTRELPKVGRKLTGNTYEALVQQLLPDEMLIGYYDRLIFDLAPHLYSESEFEEFERQVRSGMLLRIGFFAVSKEAFEKHCK